MVYNPLTPQPPDIPANSQDDFLINFSLINSLYGVDHIPFGNTIETASLENPCVIRSVNHRLQPTSSITIFSLDGINDAGVRVPWPINGNTYDGSLGELTILDEDTFSIDVDTTTFPLYIQGSGDFLCHDANYGYGFHKMVRFSQPQGQDPNRSNPVASLYTKIFSRKKFVPDFEEISSSELYFQALPSVVRQLSSIQSTVTTRGRGFITPFGLTLNMGEMTPPSQFPAFPIRLPLPYSTHLFTKATVIGRQPAGEALVASVNLGPPTVITFATTVLGIQKVSYISIGVTP